MKVTFRPLTWAGPSTPADQRRPGYTFRASWPDTIALLEQEIGHLDGRDVAVEAGFREQDIRVDGYPRAKARQPLHPGVRIAFTSKHGPLIYATDAYDSWQANFRAVALALQALRAVDRYGVTKRGEQYTGWRALPGPRQPGPREDAIAELLRLAGLDPADPPVPASVLDTAYRRAARNTHPDTGGTDQAFQRLQELWQTITGGDR